MSLPAVLLAIDLPAASLARLRAHYAVHQERTHEGRMALAAAHGDAIRAILTNGTTLIPGELIERLPRLGIICAQGVGHEGVDLAAARARGIVVTNGPSTNANCVADHAMALLLAVVRDIRGNDASVRAGGWRVGDTMRPIVTGKRVGILGLGDIGARIARRCAAFDMPVAYHNRRPVPGLALAYAPSPLALAEGSDIMVVVVPGGAGTRHLVGRAELEALGPDGFLVNVGRGSVVDTQALVAALAGGRLAGAALDVIDGEPVVPQALRELPNVVITPHIAGRSPESVAATIGLVLQNLAAHFEGRPVLTPVPGGAAP
ncbi:MAG: 2-hydroxyacid dehydrogenase [Janthinobacterium lividum]